MAAESSSPAREEWWISVSQPFLTTIFGREKLSSSFHPSSPPSSSTISSNFHASDGEKPADETNILKSRQTGAEEDSLFAKADDSLEYLRIFRPAEAPNRRLLDMLSLNEYGFRSFEWYITSQVVSTAFCVGFLIGGYRKHTQSIRRFLEHNQATMYATQAQANIKLVDFTVLMFLKNGTVMGAKVAAFCGLTAMFMAALSTYRNKFSLFYFPVATGFSGAIYKFQMGARGMTVGGMAGLVLGTVMPLPLIGIRWYSGMTWDELYKEARQMHFTQMLDKQKEDQELDQIMNEENIFFKYKARRRLEEKRTLLLEESSREERKKGPLGS